QLDFAYPDETVTVVFRANRPLRVTATNATVERVTDTESRLKVGPGATGWTRIEVVLATRSAVTPALDVAWFTAEDARLRPLPLRRVLLPWAAPASESAPA